MKKVMLVFGTRPEAIKMAPVILAIKNSPKLEPVICLTGQHKEMLNQVLEAFHIVPDYNLNVMKQNQTLSEITSNILLSIDEVLDKENPDIVLVHGDTSTTFSTALSCFYKNIPVGHIEAGLRTYNIKNPFPEEFNRQAVGMLADFHFSPTEITAQNLINENKDKNTVFVTGNTVIDALKTTIHDDYYNSELEWAEGSKLILVTAHRRENVGEPLANIARALLQLVNQNENVKIIYPVHLNPKIAEIINPIIGNHERIHLIKPLEVFDFHNFIQKSYFIMSDSGGIQEEAPSLGKPVLVLRETTERPEGVAAGTLKLVGTETESIVSEAQILLDDSEEYDKMSNASNPYGDGFASERIVKILEEKL